ncbi:hydrogenase nickel incorporation protein HypA [Sulfurifustis variabilis]|uniref:Hydrogenase maturation factor HypA n=1 Tax=Sulfurifustis variabilis TaxID=1675686 RepID=A0A1B4V5D5_9GAMM|nr:hydrogenase maturation nickel metallochaperone HypA [Sulfurifustis variabilis]BAU48733.1 hydrogenase nickel incorporation protein HypA [Sulfurifustis variabilis]
MHELSVCQGMLAQVSEIARDHGARAASRIVVRVGPLSGVEPALLAQAFPLARAGTVAAEADLVVEPAPVRVRCERCGAETEAAANRLLCGACGDYRTTLTAGDELLLVSVELVREEEVMSAKR